MHILEIYGYIHTKYEVSMSNPVDSRGVHRRHRTTTHDRQSMIIYKPLWLMIQMSQKVDRLQLVVSGYILVSNVATNIRTA